MKETFIFFWEVIKIVILALLIVVPIRYFVFEPFIVKGVSMTPAFHDGDYLIIEKLSYYFRDIQRGEVIVFKYPQNPSQRFIKRVIGLPQETITLDNQQIIIADKFGQTTILDELNYLTQYFWEGSTAVTLEDNQYFVLGDNRLHSFDSRKWGVLPEEYIVGRVVLRAWPPKAMATIETPAY